MVSVTKFSGMTSSCYQCDCVSIHFVIHVLCKCSSNVDACTASEPDAYCGALRMMPDRLSALCISGDAGWGGIYPHRRRCHGTDDFRSVVSLSPLLALWHVLQYAVFSATVFSWLLYRRIVSSEERVRWQRIEAGRRMASDRISDGGFCSDRVSASTGLVVSA